MFVFFSAWSYLLSFKGKMENIVDNFAVLEVIYKWGILL